MSIQTVDLGNSVKLSIHDVAGDGNCFYHALANALARCVPGRAPTGGADPLKLSDLNPQGLRRAVAARLTSLNDPKDTVEQQINDHIERFIEAAIIDPERSQSRPLTAFDRFPEAVKVPSTLPEVAAIMGQDRVWATELDAIVVDSILYEYGYYLVKLRSHSDIGVDGAGVRSAIVRDFEESPLLPFLKDRSAVPDVRRAARAIIILNAGNVHFKWCSMQLTPGGVDSPDVNVAEALAALGPLRPTADMKYACNNGTVGSAYDYAATTSAPTAAGVADAAVRALCESPRMKDGQRCLVQAKRSADNKRVDVTYRKKVADEPQVLFSHEQIQGLLGAAQDAPAHLIVQYIVTLAAVLCISQDMMRRQPKSEFHEMCNTSLIGPYLDRVHLQYGVDELVQFPACMKVESTDASIKITLDKTNDSNDPLSITATFAQYPHVPRLMLSMVLLNFMADAALERLPGAPQVTPPGAAGYSRTPESWRKLVGEPRPATTQAVPQPVFVNPDGRTLLELFFF